MLKIIQNQEQKGKEPKKLKNHSIHRAITNCCESQLFTDSCGDCISSKHHKNPLKSKCRKDLRYQPFTLSSFRKLSPSPAGFKTFTRDHLYLSPIQSLKQRATNLPRLHNTSKPRFIVKLKEIKQFFKLTGKYQFRVSTVL